VPDWGLLVNYRSRQYDVAECRQPGMRHGKINYADEITPHEIKPG
jgi:hypothetical protein